MGRRQRGAGKLSFERDELSSGHAPESSSCHPTCRRPALHNAAHAWRGTHSPWAAASRSAFILKTSSQRPMQDFGAAAQSFGVRSKRPCPLAAANPRLPTPARRALHGLRAATAAGSRCWRMCPRRGSMCRSRTSARANGILAERGVLPMRAGCRAVEQYNKRSARRGRRCVQTLSVRPIDLHTNRVGRTLRPGGVFSSPREDIGRGGVDELAVTLQSDPRIRFPVSLGSVGATLHVVERDIESVGDCVAN